MTDTEFRAIEKKMNQFKTLKERQAKLYNALNILSDFPKAYKIFLYGKTVNTGRVIAELLPSDLPEFQEIFQNYLETQLQDLSQQLHVLWNGSEVPKQSLEYHEENTPQNLKFSHDQKRPGESSNGPEICH